MNLNEQLSRRSLLALAALTTLAGCGGGGGGSVVTTTSASAGGASISSVGTGGTGTGTGAALNAAAFTVGTISGFGSIIVGGVRYDESSASITDDSGALKKASELGLGMRVQILSSAPTVDSQGVLRAEASQIIVTRSIIGAVTAVNIAAGSLDVLGSNVIVTPTTMFGGIAGLESVAIGQNVEVYALTDAQGRRLATRIERKDNLDADKLVLLTGVISSLNSERTEFKLGTATIRVATPLSAPLGNGSEVRVVARSTATANVLSAELVEPAPAGGFAAGVREARVEGLITAFASTQSFTVDNGIQVTATAGTQIDGAVSSLKVGARVEVAGTVKEGVVTAAKIQIKSDDGTSGSSSGSPVVDNAPFEFHGAVESVDLAESRFVLRGLTITWDSATEFLDGTVALLQAGRKVEVRGMRGSDVTSVRALRIKFES